MEFEKGTAIMIYAICVVLALFVARLVWHIVCAVRYYRSAYFKCRHRGYRKVMHDVGGRGEYFLYRELKDFEQTGARFLFNALLPLDYNTTTEADVIMVHTSGIFVFENKNYTGKIFGNLEGQYWIQQLPDEDHKGVRENQFYNPICQNETHIKAVKKALREDLPIYSVIVFGNRCQFQNITECIAERCTICRTYNAQYNVARIGKIHGVPISQEQVEQIYSTLYPYTQATEKERQEHIDNIRFNMTKKGAPDGNTLDK